LSKTTGVGDYWIVRWSLSSGRATSAGPLADDDKQVGQVSWASLFDIVDQKNAPNIAARPAVFTPR
jgi:hypothetical protein